MIILCVEVAIVTERDSVMAGLPQTGRWCLKFLLDRHLEFIIVGPTLNKENTGDVHPPMGDIVTRLVTVDGVLD
jgi:hypothetical protein